MIITPYRNTPYSIGRSRLDALQSIVDSYTTLNAWTAQKKTIDGTTTTVLDYKGLHNLANPDVASQPTFNANDSTFNNNNSFSFDSTDYFKKMSADFGNGVTASTFVFVCETPSSFATNPMLFGACDEAVNQDKFVCFVNSGGTLQFQSRESANTTNIVGTNSVTTSTKYIFGFSCDGTDSHLYINNGARETFAAQNDWLNFANTNSALDNITLGGRQSTNVLSWADGKIAACFHVSNTSNGDITNLISDLNDIYNAY